MDIKINHFDSCLICSSTKLRVLRGYEKAYLVKCDSCNFVFCSKIPSHEELKGHYNSYPLVKSISPITIKRYNELLDKFESFRKTNNIIDVGCGEGFFLEEAKKRGWNVFGTEFSGEALKRAEARGVEMTPSPLNSNNYLRDQFDIITSFEVIEHINNPRNEIDAFLAILRTGGVVYITTPNFESISRLLLRSKWNNIEYPEHLCYYSPKTLDSLFRKSNFRTIELITTGFSANRMQMSIKSGGSILVPTNIDEVLRMRTETNMLLNWMKTIVNRFLKAAAKGDAIKGLFEKM